MKNIKIGDLVGWKVRGQIRTGIVVERWAHSYADGTTYFKVRYFARGRTRTDWRSSRRLSVQVPSSHQLW